MASIGQLHRFHRWIVIAIDRCQPQCFASVEHVDIGPEDEEARNHSKDGVVEEEFDPSRVIVVKADDREQAKNYTQASQDVNSSMGPLSVAANQYTSVLGNNPSHRAKG
mmetsp:Transcript_105748/g.166944  ORF Transcript_105748/g.166944 Transcript_105748/m.166944 type:complete len:109 (+) Transcript_105748:410-736(+)